MLSHALVAVLSQTLLPRADDSAGESPITSGRVLAMEVLTNTPAIANLIREAKTAQMYGSMQMGGAQGMQTLEYCLANLVRQGKIHQAEALAKSSRPEDLESMLNSSQAAKKTETRLDTRYGGSSFGRF